MKNKFLTSKDYAKLFERAKRILDREISKPSDEWDEGLIEELEETMLYCAERKKVLLSEGKQSRRLQPSIKLRRALVIAVAVLASLAVFATVAQAAGFRVWSAIVHWDINYLRVDYTGNTTETPNDENIENEGHPIEGHDIVSIDFDSFDDLVSYAGTRVLLPSTNEEFQFVSAHLDDGGGLMMLYSEYLYRGKSIIIDVMNSRLSDYDTISQSFVDTSEYDDVYKQDVNGIECVIGEQEERVYCSFAYKDSVYRIICNAGKEAMISIIQTMIKGDVL